MRATCANVVRMGMIQIRNVPDDLHRLLKARAAAEGTSLSEYLLREVRKSAGRPTLQELTDRLRRLEPITTEESPAEIIRRMRDAAG